MLRGFLASLLQRTIPLCLLLVVPVALGAQSPAAPVPGTRLRIVPASGGPVTGTLVSLRPDSLLLMVDGSVRAYATSELARSETFAGRRSQAGKGARLGLVVGLIGGIMVGLADGNDPPGTFFALSAGDKAMAAGAGLGLLGMGIGAGVGAASREDRWEPLTISADAQVARASVRVGSRVAF